MTKVLPAGLRFAPLDWDTEFWGEASARLDIPASATPPLVAVRDAIERAQGAFDFLQLLVPAAKIPYVQLAQRAGFLLVDLRCEVHLRRGPRVRSGADTSAVRLGSTDDVDRVGTLAADCHDNSRFASDPALPPERVRDLYRRWIRRDATTPGWTLAVAESAAGVDGYVTFGPSGDATGTIGLIGVAQSARGVGLGRQLVGHATNALMSAGCELVQVVTHGGSLPAMHMYQAEGFTIADQSYWLHWHRGAFTT